MINYRRSYWKSTLVAAVGTIISLMGVLILWANRPQGAVLGMTWVAEVPPLVYWPGFLLGIAFAICFLAITLGGIICLHSDARDKAAPKFHAS
jgi:hypothetical protein